MTRELKRRRVFLTIAALVGIVAAGCSRSEQAASGNADDAAAPPLPMPAAQDQLEPVEPPALPVPPEEDEVAATVDGEEIMLSEMRLIFDDHYAGDGNQYTDEQLDTFWNAELPVIIEMVIGKRLIDNEIARREIRASDEEIEARLAKIEERLPEGRTLEELTNQTSDEIREAIGEMLAYEQLLELHDLAVSDPTDEQVQAYYDDNIENYMMPERVEARHILLAVEHDADEDTRADKLAQIQSLRDELVDGGADFAELAANHSDCPSRERGGSLGVFGRNRMVPQFELAAFTQEPGVVGEVVETAFGYHLIEVVDKQPAAEIPLDEVREHVAGRLQGQASYFSREQLIKKLRATVDIRYFIP